MKIPKPYNTALLTASTALMVLSVGLATNSLWQAKVRNYLYPEGRTVLASLQTNLNVNGLNYKVLKIRSSKKIWIEIYDLNKPSSQVVAFSVDSKADGQMSVGNKTSPLFASDLDGDSIMEILAPTFGLDFQPQIHAFQWNPQNGEFYKVPPEKLVKLL